MILYFHVDTPHEWVLLDRHSGIMDKGASITLDVLSLPKRLSQLVGVVPGTFVTTHDIELSARTKSKALAAIPYALEERLATDVDELVFALLDWKPGESATVSVVEKRYVESLEQRFTELSWNVTALVPEFLLVPLHKQAQFTLAKLTDGSYALRSGECNGMVFDGNTLEYWWSSLEDPDCAIAVNDREVARRLIELGGTTISEWDIGKTFSEWLAHGRTPTERSNIVRDFHPNKTSNQSEAFYHAAVVLLCVGIATKVGMDLYENYLLHKKNNQIDREIVQIFQRTFPDITRIVNPRLQMEQRIKALKAGTVDAGQFQMLVASVARVMPLVRATLEEITFRDHTLLITCTTENFAGLDKLKQHFAKDPSVRVELISSGSKDNKVSARFKLQSA
ncbi:MAG: type II secretion system protein GspL [Arenicellales bacterium]|nr:type II secretion system protein GspL [Arenicellales bacterium]